MHVTGDFFFPVSYSVVAELICEVFNPHCDLKSCMCGDNKLISIAATVLISC